MRKLLRGLGRVICAIVGLATIVMGIALCATVLLIPVGVMVILGGAILAGYGIVGDSATRTQRWNRRFNDEGTGDQGSR